MTDAFTTTPPTREQLLYWLHEASEIEHHLMCCYLYAAFSLKHDDARWTAEQRAAVSRWRRAIVSVAMEEMTHMALVGNLVSALGGTPHLGRLSLPVDSGPYPAGFVIRLAPFCAATIEHFKFLERPQAAALTDGQGFEQSATYHRAVPEGRLSPGPRDYSTVGELYDVLAESLKAMSAAFGEASLFIGDPALQLDSALTPLPGVAPVTDLASALVAISTIVTQGEGAGEEECDSHFMRFTRISTELAELRAQDPTFEPAWPAATNPVMNVPVKAAAERVHIDHPLVSRWLDIGNAIYTTSLRCLLQGFGAADRKIKGTWLSVSYTLMRAVVPVAQGLAARPAHADRALPHAGLTFTPLRGLTILPSSRAAQVLSERLGQLVERAQILPVQLVDGETEETWPKVISVLEEQQAVLRSLAGLADTVPPPAPQKPQRREPSPSAVVSHPEVRVAPETVRGRAVTVIFDAQRCIHSRHCVLDAPTVFKANTPGEWIFPDTVTTEALVGVAHNCPSGAISYSRHDGGPEEEAPLVNQLRVRENGPYAIHATLQVGDSPDGFRATLCRCGQSARKPWCDGSHASVGFSATGEPPTGALDPLTPRGGPLQVLPLRDGPLQVHGPLEICSGTGRAVARVTQARLCRCGQSRNKPFCDLSHMAAGFTADGH